MQKNILFLTLGLSLLLVLLYIFIGNENELMVNENESFRVREINDDIKSRMQGVSMKDNAQISYDDLRYLTLTYYGYDGKSHNGEMIVNKLVAEDVINIFKELYKAQFPIEKMVLIDDYNANDEESMKDNNTSGFNYRVIADSDKLSYHSKGLAIDINPLYNPYYNLETGLIQPQNAQSYLNRNKMVKGMILPNDVVVNTFKKYGWIWGGDWSNPVDYQHFEKQL